MIDLVGFICADPTLILLGVSTAISAGGSVLGGMEESRAQEANARVAEANAQRTAALGAQNEAVARREARQLEGQSIANVGASGITLSGSALDYTIDQQIEAETAALQQRYAATDQANAYKQEANASRRAGKNALTSGVLGGAAQLIGGGANIYAKMKQA